MTTDSATAACALTDLLRALRNLEATTGQGSGCTGIYRGDALEALSYLTESEPPMTATPTHHMPTLNFKPTGAGKDDEFICANGDVVAVVRQHQHMPKGQAEGTAAFIVHACNNFDAVLAELEKAHRIIHSALNLMTPAQKHLWASKNAADECDGEGTTRAHEREDVITRAQY